MNDVVPPKNPITLKVNGWLVENYLHYFMNKYLPAFIFKETSGYRDEDHNREVGGVEDSSHLYNLARDGVLIRISTGEMISEEEGFQLFNEYFAPFWNGYAEFNPTTISESWYIHINLSRKLVTYTKWTGVFGISLIGGLLIRKYVISKK